MNRFRFFSHFALSVCIELYRVLPSFGEIFHRFVIDVPERRDATVTECTRWNIIGHYNAVNTIPTKYWGEVAEEGSGFERLDFPHISAPWRKLPFVSREREANVCCRQSPNRSGEISPAIMARHHNCNFHQITPKIPPIFSFLSLCLSFVELKRLQCSTFPRDLTIYFGHQCNRFCCFGLYGNQSF